MTNKLKDSEQYLLQQFLSRGVLDQFNFKEIFRLVLDKFEIGYNRKEKDEFNCLIVAYMKHINAAIKVYSMEIKMGKCEVTGVTFYCLVRQYDSAGLGNLSKLYSIEQLKVFKLILDTIIASNEGMVELAAIIDLISNELLEAPMSLDAIKLTIDRFIKDYWLILHTNKNLALHGRTVIELGQYLVEVYGPDSVLNCSMCQQIVIHGIQCDQCFSKMHNHCAKKYFKSRNDCVSCKNTFADDEISHLRAADTPQPTQTQQQTQLIQTQIKQDSSQYEEEPSQGVTKPKRKK